MPKMKTSKSAAKRLRTTKTGGIKRAKSFASHYLTKKSSKRKRHLRKATTVAITDKQRIKRLIPYV